MPDPLARLAIQSWCFRHFKDNADVIRHLKSCGVTNVELCGVHASPQGADGGQAAIEQYKKAGISVPTWGVEGFDGDEAKARKAFDFAKRAGATVINADFWGDTQKGVAVAEKLGKEYGIKVALHNHGRKHRLGAVWEIEALLARTTSVIGLCLDTGWMIDSGEDPVAVATKFKSRLHAVHIKDFTFDRAGKEQDVVSGTGNLKLDELAAVLGDGAWNGNVTIEYEGDEQQPVASLTKCVEATRKAFAKTAKAR